MDYRSVKFGWRKTRRFPMKDLPILLGGLFGILWAAFFLIMGKLTGMWDMADKRFPFLVSSIFVAHDGGMSPFMSTLLAFLDGAIVGLIAGVLFQRLAGTQEE